MDINRYRVNLRDWLEKLTGDLEPGRFRFCLGGDLVPISGKQAQFTTCFAVKAAWQAGIWEEWPKKRQHASMKFLQSFQDTSGFFRDPWLINETRPTLKSKMVNVYRSILGKSTFDASSITQRCNIRAETRQTTSTLLMIGQQPLYPVPVEVTSRREVKKYLNGFDWSNPWAAGSHLSHLIFLTTINKKTTASNRHQSYINHDSIIEEIDNFLNELWKAEDGCWFRGKPSNLLKINGAMKIISGLQWLNRPYPDCRNLMDLALSNSFEADGCGFVNRLFVVHEARKGVPKGYRSQEIHELALAALNAITRFHREDGGFSFYTKRAQTHYYGARTSKGLLVGDLHGAVMMTWGIALSLAMLNNHRIPGQHLWRVHRA